MEYMSDRHHPFRIIPKRWFYATEEDGKCYLVYKEAAEREQLPSEDLLEKRIDRLLKWLRNNGVTPAAIDICRSGKSGYLQQEPSAEGSLHACVLSWCLRMLTME